MLAQEQVTRRGLKMDSVEAKIVRVAEAMIEGKMQLIQGCREICGLLSHTLEPERDAFLAIKAIDSETDHFPLGDVRRECAPDYLKRMDCEMDRYIEAAREDILHVCHELIQIFR